MKWTLKSHFESIYFHQHIKFKKYMRIYFWGLGNLFNVLVSNAQEYSLWISLGAAKFQNESLSQDPMTRWAKRTYERTFSAAARPGYENAASLLQRDTQLAHQIDTPSAAGGASSSSSRRTLWTVTLQSAGRDPVWEVLQSEEHHPLCLCVCWQYSRWGTHIWLCDRGAALWLRARG